MSETVLTLVASDQGSPLSDTLLDELNITYDDKIWLSANRAVDLYLSPSPSFAEATLSSPRRGEGAIAGFCDTHKIDFFITQAKNRKKSLMLCDMDSTMVAEETLDELAGKAGIKDEIAAITERAMRGELDFHAAIKERVKLIEGLSEDFIAEAVEEMTINPGARALVKTMKAHGALCVLVSGGFTHFTGAVAAKLGFDHHHGNSLIIKNGKLTGEVGEPIQDKHSKLEYLKFYSAKPPQESFRRKPESGSSEQPDSGLRRSDTENLENALTIGDGANDLPMLEAAGLGVGYHAKPLVQESLPLSQIKYGDLSAALYAQGFKDEEFQVE